jgi:hypothetical protein
MYDQGCGQAHRWAGRRRAVRRTQFRSGRCGDRSCSSRRRYEDAACLCCVRRRGTKSGAAVIVAVTAWVLTRPSPGPRIRRSRRPRRRPSRPRPSKYRTRFRAIHVLKGGRHFQPWIPCFQSLRRQILRLFNSASHAPPVRQAASAQPCESAVSSRSHWRRFLSPPILNMKGQYL